MRWRHWGAIGVIALAGCTRVSSDNGAQTRHPWTKPGVLRIATIADPKSLNPIVAAATPTLELSAFLFSYTVRYDNHAKPVPDAVERIPSLENGDVSRDGLTLTYRLRRGMTWHDGAPVECKDLRFTWQAVMNPHNNVVTTDGYKDIKSIDCSNPLVAVVHMKRVYAPFLQQLWSVNGNAPILPEHVLAKYNDAKGSFNNAPFHAAPVGSGPFRFVSWDRGSTVTMKAYDKFYLGRPKLDTVIYKIMPDENTLATQLETHEIDLLFAGTGAIWDRIRNVPGTTAITPSVYTYTHIDFNLKRPIFQDLRVREALAYAIDRPSILAKVQHGLGELAEADESPSIGAAYTADTVKHPYDVAKANALLDAAGWRRGSDGTRVKDGVPLQFTYATQNESTNGRAIQAAVQAYWHAVGANAVVKNAPTSLFYDNTARGVLQGYNYDVASFSWIAAADPDDSAIYSADNLAPRGQNAMYWRDPVATKAMNDALLTVDMKKRIPLYHIVQQRLAADVPTIILYFRHEPEVYNDDLKGFTATPVITVPFWNTWEYSI